MVEQQSWESLQSITSAPLSSSIRALSSITDVIAVINYKIAYDSVAEETGTHATRWHVPKTWKTAKEIN
jgi:hypothetical protein